MNQKRSLENIILSINDLLDKAKHEKIKLSSLKKDIKVIEDSRPVLESEKKANVISDLKLNKENQKPDNIKKHKNYDWSKNDYFTNISTNIDIEDIEKATERIFKEQILKWSNQKINNVIRTEIKNKTLSILK